MRISNQVQYSDAPSTQRHIPKSSEDTSSTGASSQAPSQYKPAPAILRPTNISHKPQMDRQEFRGLSQHPSAVSSSSRADNIEDHTIRAAPGSLPISDAFAQGFSLSVMPTSTETVPWDYKSRSFSEKSPFSLPQTVEDTVWRRKPHPSLGCPYKQSRPELGTVSLATYRTQYPSDSNSLDREFVAQTRNPAPRERALPAAVADGIAADGDVRMGLSMGASGTKADEEAASHLFHARGMSVTAQQMLAEHSHAGSRVASARITHAWQHGRTGTALRSQPNTQRLFSLAGVPAELQTLPNSTVRVPHPVDYNRAEKRTVPKPTVVSVKTNNPHALTQGMLATSRQFNASAPIATQHSERTQSLAEESESSSSEDEASSSDEEDSTPALPPIGAKRNMGSTSNTLTASGIVRARAVHPMYKLTSEDYGARFQDEVGKHYVYFPRTHNFSNSLKAMK